MRRRTALHYAIALPATLSVFVACLTSTGWTGCNRDVVTITNFPEVGLLVDGRSGDVDRQDMRFLATSPSVAIGGMTHSASSNHVIAFMQDKQPAIVDNVTWTGDDDVVPLQFVNTLAIPITVHVIDNSCTSCDVLRNVADALVYAIGCWNRERVGLTFSTDIDVRNEEGLVPDPNDRLIYEDDISFTTLVGDGATPGLVPPVANRLNVYIVTAADGTPASAFTSSIATGNIMIVGKECEKQILAHEVGHACALGHSDEPVVFGPSFDQTNLMHSSCTGEGYVTEGQTFRMFFDILSSLHTKYLVNPTTARTFPDVSTPTPGFPPLDKRIWADGAKGPN